jgi:hypothetical protein
MVEPTRGTRMLPEDALRIDWVCARHCPSLEQFRPFADLLFYVFAQERSAGLDVFQMPFRHYSGKPCSPKLSCTLSALDYLDEKQPSLRPNANP